MAFPLLGKVDFSTWTAGEIATGSWGQKSAPVFGDSKPCPHLQLCTTQAAMHCPFGASAYNDDGSATRLNMDWTSATSNARISGSWTTGLALEPRTSS